VTLYIYVRILFDLYIYFIGITEKVSYFKRLDVGAIWLSPIFLSPQNDFGYDISDYEEIDPVYGTMEDFERLRDEFHKNGSTLNLIKNCF